MSCPKNILNFLGIKYEGKHNFELEKIQYCINQDGIPIYKVIWICSLCKSHKVEWMWEEDVIREWGQLPKDCSSFGLSGEDFIKQINGIYKPHKDRFY